MAPLLYSSYICCGLLAFPYAEEEVPQDQKSVQKYQKGEVETASSGKSTSDLTGDKWEKDRVKE